MAPGTLLQRNNLMPEDVKNNELTPELEELLEELKSNEAFRVCRGNLGARDWLSTGILRTGGLQTTPTKVIEEFDYRTSRTRIMLNMLTKLRREGKTQAALELESALTDNGFVLTGEDLPIDQRVYGTLAIFEPERTLELLKWSSLLIPEIIDRHLGQKNEWHSPAVDRPEFKEWTLRIMEKNPEIEAALSDIYANPMRLSHRRSFMPDCILDLGYGNKWDYDILNNQLGGNAVFMHNTDAPSNDDHVGNWCIGRFFFGKTQAEVLGKFDRKQQEEIATWQFHCPAHLCFGGYDGNIGLFPESEHARLCKKWPAYVSGSKCHRLGAVILEKRLGHQRRFYDPLFDEREHRWSPETPDINKVGFRLHFKR